MQTDSFHTWKKTGKRACVTCFFDEIHELDGWQTACKTLRLHNNSVFISGSNSKLLSGEFTAELSGRYVSFRIRPFVFKELIEYAKELKKNISVTDYLVWGDFPKRIEFNTLEAQQRYLNDLDDTIVFNALIRHHAIRKEPLFKSFVNFILRSNSRIYSAQSIQSYIKQEYIRCSSNTIMKYLDYLEEAFIIDRVKQYSTKTKRKLNYYAKIYDSDVALNPIRCPDNRYDLTHNLENLVYNELLYMGYNVYVYNNAGKEIDFMATKGSKTYFVQVAYSIMDDNTFKREFEAF